MVAICKEDLEKCFSEIHTTMIQAINSITFDGKEEPRYLLLASKIISNLNSGTTLATRGRWGDSRILIRSAFETFILLKLFQHYPERFQEWQDESELMAFRNSFVLHKHYPDELPDTDLIAHYQNLPEHLKAKYSLEKAKMGEVWYYKKDKLDKKLQSFKSKFSNIRTMIDEIALKDESFLSYVRFRFNLYDENSQIAHGDFLKTFKFYANYDKQDFQEHLQEFVRQYGLILIQTMQALTIILEKDFGDIYTPFLKNIRKMFCNNEAKSNKDHIISVKFDPTRTLYSLFYN